MRWIANTTPRQIDASLRSLSAGGKRVVKGEPNATETHTAAALVKLGYVGLYEMPNAEGHAR